MVKNAHLIKELVVTMDIVLRLDLKEEWDAEF